jgi:putative ABC transport system permease protein
VTLRSNDLTPGVPAHNPGWLYARIAFQNLLRKPARTLMLLLAVGLGTGAVFASFIVARGIEASMENSFARMGADLVVVPSDAMVNITSALLTVQPTEATLDAGVVDTIGQISGVERVAPQTIYRVPLMSGMPRNQVNLIAFDPARDFTVMPWVVTRLERPMASGDVLSGGRRPEAAGQEIAPCGVPAAIYGKLGRSGVGPFDESLFATYDTVAAIARHPAGGMNAIPSFHPGRISAALVRLEFGATPEQVRFAIARLPGVKIISGATVVTATRQAAGALLGGMLVFTIGMLAGSLLLMSLVFSAIIGERRREIGLLRAIGSRSASILSMLMAEAGFATGLGGLCGILFGSGLLLIFQRSLVYHLETLHVDFAWPAPLEIAAGALACAALAVIVGFAGALVPAWRASAEEPYVLIQGEGG